MSNAKTAVDFAESERLLLQSFPWPLVPTNLKGAYTLREPPTTLDPSAAGVDLLIENGIWPSPTQSKFWERLYSRKEHLQWISPELEPRPGKIRTARKSPKQPDNPNIVLTTNWSGAVVSGGGPWRRVEAMWWIPTVSMPPEGAGNMGDWESSSWVGIDGYSTNDVLQAGVYQNVNASGNAYYLAWFEWFAPNQPGSPSYINPVVIPFYVGIWPGGPIACLVSYLSIPTLPPILTNIGNILFLQLTTGQAFQVILIPPPGADASGDSVEWIMEAPGGGEPVTSLPSFTPIAFAGPLYGNANGNSFPSSAVADTLNIYNPNNGMILTSTFVAGLWVFIGFVG
jgi:hypothetical protein